MTDYPRWTISELAARYDLEPELKDIFVEGPFARDLIRKLLLNDGGRAVYEINSVDVGAELLRKHRFSIGNKQMVIVLSRELAVITVGGRVKCLVDQDLDHWFGELETNHTLVWTEYNSLESYFLDEYFIRTLIIDTAKAKIDDFYLLMKTLIYSLRVLFAFRLADRELALSLDWIAFDRYCSLKGSVIELDKTNYIVQVLNKNNKYHKKREVEASVESWLARLQGDPRLETREHDFIESLSWLIRAGRGMKEFAQTAVLQRLLVFAADRFSELREVIQ